MLKVKRKKPKSVLNGTINTSTINAINAAFHQDHLYLLKPSQLFQNLSPIFVYTLMI